MTVTIRPGHARGRTMAPPSKSMAHRLLLLAGLSEGTSTVYRLSDCEDVRATVDCLRAMGIRLDLDGDTATVTDTVPLAGALCVYIEEIKEGSI